MSPRCHVPPTADRDLDDQAGYLARQASLETAPRFHDAAAATFVAIARSPGLGQQHESTNPRLAGLCVRRVEGFEKHLIFHQPAGDGVEIVRVLHGARDIDGVMAEESDEDAYEQTHRPGRDRRSRAGPINLRRTHAHRTIGRNRHPPAPAKSSDSLTFGLRETTMILGQRHSSFPARAGSP